MHKPVGLYIHLPWCLRKCPYCDFNSHAVRGVVPFERYAEALLVDLGQALETSPGRRIASVFIGGGTPSLFPPATLAPVLALTRSASVAGAEITLEANPGAADEARFAAFRDLGVNRLSIGIQSFDDRSLQALGRVHQASDGLRAMANARSAGFGRINLDLMFALPGQTLAQAVADIEQAIDLGPEHISSYQLTIEPNTVFHRRPPQLPDEDLAWAMQDAIGQRLLQAGYEQYEVSAWARPGEACQHNLNYWRYGDYLAIGAGAHGKLGHDAGRRIVRHRNMTVPERYIEQALLGQPQAQSWVVSDADKPLEFLMNRFRLLEAFTAADYRHGTGLAFADLVAGLQRFIDLGLVEQCGDSLRILPQGRLHLDAILQTLLPDAHNT